MISKYAIYFFLFCLVSAQVKLKEKNSSTQISENEVHFGSKISESLLEDIKIGREEQRKKKEELDQMAKELNMREKAIQERMEELKKIHEKNLALVKQMEEQKILEHQAIEERKKNIKKLIEAFSNSSMEPQIKLKTLLSLDEQSAIEIMREMPIKQLAQVLNLSESAPLSQLMAGSSKKENGIR